MRGKGINYDTGVRPGGVNSREHLDPNAVRGEMRIIARDLHCTAVRITGGEPARLSLAGQLAAAEGLEVWFAPFPCELTTGQLAPLFEDCADRAEAGNPSAHSPHWPRRSLAARAEPESRTVVACA